jgi:hypothetical protein
MDVSRNCGPVEKTNPAEGVSLTRRSRDPNRDG